MAVEKVGILRLDYIYRVMRKVYFEKVTITNPDSFKSKLRSLEKAERVAKLKRVNSNTSLLSGSMSQTTKTQTHKSSSLAKSEVTSNKSGGTDGPSKHGNASDDDIEHGEDDNETINTLDAKKNPIMVALTSVFQDMQQ